MIELAGIQKSYQMGEIRVQALQDVSLNISRGEFVAIMGPSGSGKSTLMHIVGLLDTPDTGSFHLNHREVRTLSEDERAILRARTIGFVFQQFNLLARVSALDNVSLPLIYAPGPGGANPTELLRRVGLENRAHHAPSELSGGQQQRVAIARALVNQPAILMADEPTGNLDSASSKEVLNILRELHRSGLTVIIVTHDADVAKIADRIITMKDGRIISDSTSRNGIHDGKLPRQPAETFSGGRHVRQRLLEITALLRQAGRALAASKMRTFLSMLGVLIGVAAVITVMALGAGAQKAVEQRITSMGANLLVLMPARHQTQGISLGAGAVSRLTLSDAHAIRSEIPDAVHVSSTLRGTVQSSFENRNWRTTLLGAEPDYETIHAMRPQAGRFFTLEELDARTRVAVIGITVCKELFNGINPVGQTIRINRDRFEVIGLLPDKGSSAFMDENDQIIVPVSTAMRRILGQDYIGEIEIQVETAQAVSHVEQAAITLMARRHRIPTDADESFRVRNMADLQDMMESTSRTMSVLLTAVSAISLLIGGIGIMNIMLVSVTERTREIGIRKAVGARRSDILLQFLVESVVVSVCGGVIGMIIGVSSSLTMSRIAGWTSAITPFALLIAFSFSVLVGVVFGLWPAQKASALQPINALRYE